MVGCAVTLGQAGTPAEQDVLAHWRLSLVCSGLPQPGAKESGVIGRDGPECRARQQRLADGCSGLLVGRTVPVQRLLEDSHRVGHDPDIAEKAFSNLEDARSEDHPHCLRRRVPAAA